MAILGIDEVGRGPLAGPLVVGAVVLPEGEREWYAELKDSKKLTAKKREVLSRIITEQAAVGLGWVQVAELDEVGMAEALVIATRRAVKSIQRLHAAFSQIIIDGKVNFLKGTALENYVTTVVKADDKVREVSAASIVAKQARDEYMVEKVAIRYPEYGFEKHVGYGTAAHVAAVYRYGLTPEHRKSFEPCRTLAGFSKVEVRRKDTTDLGKQGEDAVCEYLKRRGHEIVARNHKTYFYEIDIVSVKDEMVYFTEVKYRRDGKHGDGLEVITAEKRHRMVYAAESYMKYVGKMKNYNPVLAVAAVGGENFEVDAWVVLEE